ncbi:uncharacterized protein LOC115883735 isoform X1 [Sitophilus oryzae]|uniref:Uncharacterized protein LOC115883735 isoform X1 n=1 Tax=Sitophilus oryzae TaxID=7048 RepID=A0A6J2Y4U2_SITOR|nr:uncharacterized protein LOC115883735 isoform X1 [Sitophilus oryzae]
MPYICDRGTISITEHIISRMLIRNCLLVFVFSLVSCRPQSNLAGSIASSSETNIESATKVTLVPFYGGGKGQSLQITETSDGKLISSVIVKTPVNPPPPLEQTEIEIDPLELENPPLPTKFDIDLFEGYEFIRNIQKNAGEIVRLQELAKKNGELTKEDEEKYNNSMASINNSVQQLVEVQENTSLGSENREGLTQWFEKKRENNKKKNELNKNEKVGNKKEPEKEVNKNEEKEEEQEEENEDENDAVAVNLPPEDASVAEAKPIGLAVAGEGGVAASKPIATAVVGPGGLAIARPVATAIAGVSPDQALVPIYAEGLGSAPHKKHSKIKTDGMNEFLNRIITKYHNT